MSDERDISVDGKEQMNSLSRRAGGALKWSTLNQVLEQGFAFCVGLLLARILDPGQFGLVAMVMVFVVISKVLAEGGMRLAVIQKKDLSESDCSTALWLNILLALVVVSLLWAVAPLIAGFYDEPRLTWIVRVLSLRLLCKAPGVIQLALIEKNLDFKLLTRSSLPANIISGLFGLYLAIAGHGVWALVVMGVVQDLLMSLFFWRVSDWRPSRGFDLSSVKAILPFGLRMAGSGLVNAIFDNLYTLVIGKFYAPAQVGFYHRARSFERLPSRNFDRIGGRVLFPLLSMAQDDPLHMRKGMVRVCRLIAFTIFPVMLFMFVVAPDMIILLIGEKWLPSALLLQILCFSGALQSLQVMNMQALSARGHADLFFRLSFIKRGISMVILFSVVWHGLTAIVAGQVVSAFIAFIINTYYTRKFLDYGLVNQIADLLPYMLSSAVTALLTLGVLQLLGSGAFLRILVAAFVFWGSYIAICCTFRLSAVQESLQIVFGDKPVWHTILAKLRKIAPL